MMNRSDDRSYFERVSGGSCNSRWNMVGTMWVWVMWCRSINASVSSADHPSISTMPVPHANGTSSDTTRGAAWYSGPVHKFLSASGW